MIAMRHGIVAALAVAALLAGAPAWAGTYYYCYLENAYGDEGYVYTPVMKTSLDRIDENATGYKFYEYANSRVTYTDIGGGVHATCNSTGTAESIQKYHAQHIQQHGGVLLEWLESPLPPEPEEDTGAPAGALVIEKVESFTEAPEVLAARALAEERRRAAAMAKVLADNARRDAELDAKLQETIRRDKRRGSMQ